MNMEKLVAWVKESDGRRKVTVDIGDTGNSDFTSIWVYDYDLMEGTHISAPDDIDNINLIEVKRQKLESQLNHFNTLVEREG